MLCDLMKHAIERLQLYLEMHKQAAGLRSSSLHNLARQVLDVISYAK